MFKHSNRPGFWFGFIDFFTAGLFFLFYMPLGGLQDELDYILGRRTQRYWVAYLLGIPTLDWQREYRIETVQLHEEGSYPPVDKDDYRNWRRIDRSQEEEFGELVVRK